MKIYSNKKKQVVSSPGILGAVVRGYKSESEVHETLNGDSFLINIKRKIFAVADSPDWNHWKSKKFLQEFNEMVELIFSNHSNLFSRKNDFEASRKIFIDNTNKLIKGSKYLETTTFTCIFLIGQKDDLRCMMLHCGDSCLFKADIEKKYVHQISTPNFNFVGRAKKLSQVEMAEVDKNTRFILCSDGLMVLLRNKNFSSLEALLLDSLQKHSVEEVPESLIHFYGKDIDIHDDITIIALDPSRITEHTGTYIF
ncbi:MAG: SpoIIE family protein phosphatase [archaeon]|nr:SpoIIE family protein phosphatase [archaeon]